MAQRATPGRASYPRAWLIANTLRNFEGTTRVAAFVKQERGETIGTEPYQQDAHKVLRLHVESQNLTSDDIPRSVDDPEKLIHRIRVLSEVLSRDWLPWLQRAERMSDEEERWARELLHEMVSIALELGHATAAGEAVVTHAVDFSWLDVRGKRYDFPKAQQRSVIRELFKAREAARRRDGAGLHEDTLRDLIGSAADGFRVAKLFDGHEALNSILRSTRAKGGWALFLSDAEDSA